MGHRGRLIVTMFALAGALTACTSAQQGSPTTAPGSSTTAATEPSSAQDPAPTPTITDPVDLQGIKPCSLFSGQVSAVADTSGDAQTIAMPTLPDSSACFQFNDKANVGLTLAVATTTGIEDFADPQAGQVQAFSVAGYPAAVLTPSTSETVCLGAVGMADDQLLYVQYALANPGGTPKVPQQQLCAKVRPIVEAVVAQIAQR
jgi:hypothetical protein